MTPELPFARGLVDALPRSREVADPVEVLANGPQALAEPDRAGTTGVSAFLVDPAGLLAVRVPGGEAEPVPVRLPGRGVRADSDTPFATLPVGETAGGIWDEGDAASRGRGPTRAGAGAAGVAEATEATEAPADQRIALWHPDAAEAARLARAGHGALLMGRTADGVVHVGVRVAEALEVPGVAWANIRWCGHLLSGDESALAVAAVALVRWRAQTLFCARCGHELTTTGAGWTTTCAHCGTIEYPRQDPAVIMAVIDAEDRVLMAHNTGWRAGFWSVLAGFVEAGESPDRAVRREVLEEVGLQVAEVRYFSAQPWPMPRSLMLGFHAHVAPGAPAEPHPDGSEIDRARFFSREELAQAITSGALEPPGPTAIARFMIEDWFGGPLPASPRRIDPLRTS